MPASSSSSLEGDKVPALSSEKGKVLVRGRYVLASSLLLNVEEGRRTGANYRVFALIVEGNESNSLVIVVLSLNRQIRIDYRVFSYLILVDLNRSC